MCWIKVKRDQKHKLTTILVLGQYDAFGYEAESKHMTECIHRVRAESGGDKGLSLKV
jgi:hypothetical protein